MKENRFHIIFVMVAGIVTLSCNLVRTLSPRVTPTETISPTYIALHVNEFPTFTIYWDRLLWEQELAVSPVREDFELDSADPGELSFPFLSGHGFLLEELGDVTAQILNDPNLLGSGNQLHIRAWQEGLGFHFPDGQAVTAFGFDYKGSDDWILRIHEVEILVPKGRRGFVGVIMIEDYPMDFNLTSENNAQGGLSIDNLLYVHQNP